MQVRHHSATLSPRGSLAFPITPMFAVIDHRWINGGRSFSGSYKQTKRATPASSMKWAQRVTWKKGIIFQGQMID